MDSVLDFLQGGGEMGERTRSYDWSKTSLGAAHTWPQSLRTTLSILLNSRFPMFLFWGPDLLCFYNDAYRPSLGGGDKQPATLGQPGAEVWPEIWPIIKPQIDQVLANGEATWHENKLGAFYRNGRLEAGYWTYSYSPVRDETGRVAGVFVTCMETTKAVENTQQLTQTNDELQRLLTENQQLRQQEQAVQQQLLTLFEQSPVAIALVSGEDLVYRLANPFYAQLVDRPLSELIGRPMSDAIPELSEQGFDNLLRQVMQTGVPYVAPETRAELIRKSVRETIYVDLTYQPQREADGRVSGVFIVATDVTQQVRSRHELTRQKAQLQSIIDATPVGIALFVGQDRVISTINQPFAEIVGQGPNISGKLLRDVIPESNDQLLLSVLTNVYTSQQPFYGTTISVRLVRQGIVYDNFYNISYIPLLDDQKQTYAILGIAVDVTQQVNDRQTIQVSEQQKTFLLTLTDRLRALTDPAEIYKQAAYLLGTYLGADRVGYAEDQGDEETIVVRHNYVKDVPDLSGTYRYADYEPLLTQFLAGKTVVRSDIANDATLTDAEKEAHRALQLGATVNKPLLWSGRPMSVLFIHYQQAHVWLADEISLLHEVANRIILAIERAEAELALRESEQRYRLLSKELDGRVNVRTQELEIANQDLKRSNDNLQQFAYVASHDLQEPLRKIQSFSTLLAQQHTEHLNEAGLDILRRVQVAGERMSTLIRDLLTYSRIATRQQTFGSVSLKSIMAIVLDTLEWPITQTHAEITVDDLPVINGDESQLSQLFQNLLANAIKFTPAGRVPQIQVRYARQMPDDLPDTIRPARQAPFYHQISVKDNGVGFDTKYLDRIFQVFQRLHGKGEFEGTGVGLAICQRVVENHGGAITADSQPGQGATFYVYLPS